MVLTRRLSVACAAVVLAVIVLGCGHAFSCVASACDTTCAEADSTRPRDSVATSTVCVGLLAAHTGGEFSPCLDLEMTFQGVVSSVPPPERSFTILRI